MKKGAKTERSESQKKADQRYNAAKKTFYTIAFTPTDRAESLRLQSYLDTLDISANSYFKQLIKSDLDSKGIPYIDVSLDDTK